MRTYRSTMPETKHGGLNQPPLVGAGWPAVRGKTLDEMDLSRPPLAEPTASQGFLPVVDKFPVYLMASALCFTLGRTHRAFTLGSVVFGALATWKAWRTWRGR